MSASHQSHYIFPDQVFAGFDSVAQTGPALKQDGIRHAFLIADPGVVRAGLHSALLASLASAGVAHTLYAHVIPNPDTASVDTAVGAYRSSDADAVVAIGGGSALDTGKAVRMVVAGPVEGRVRDYAYKMGDAALPHPRRLPTFAAIPTTAGTGAEVTPWAVITDPADKTKFGVGGPRSVPDIAIVDPALMLTLPAALTASTGMDALTHLIEAYVSTNHNPLLDPMILDAIGMVTRNLPIAVARGDNRAAREGMAQAALAGGIAISSKWLGACHSVAHQLSGFANVPHGLANAIMLPHVMRYNLPGAVERFANVDHAMGGPQNGDLRMRAESAIARVEQLNRDIGLPSRLQDAGVQRDVIPEMAKMAYTVDLNWWTNPRSVDQQVMEQLYLAAY
jgi:alcohol dehydrogenase class IV